jgi:hypothetical protein
MRAFFLLLVGILALTASVDANTTEGAPATPATPTIECPKGQRVCGNGCYEPKKYFCHFNSFLCDLKQGGSICGASCYDSADYRCVKGQLYTRT